MARGVLLDSDVAKHPSRVSRTAIWLAVVLVALVAGSRGARAGEASEAGASEKPQTSWYGWQTLLSDAGAIGMWALAWKFSEETYGPELPNRELAAKLLFASGLATYAFGAPIIHGRHGHGGKVLGSLGLRAGIPIGGLLLGLVAGAATCKQEVGEYPCPITGAVVGFVAGVVLGAPVLDAVFLAREPITPTPAPRFQAAFVPSGGGGTCVLAGRF